MSLRDFRKRVGVIVGAIIAVVSGLSLVGLVWLPALINVDVGIVAISSMVTFGICIISITAIISDPQ